MQPRGETSAVLSVGETVEIDWGFRQTAEFHWDIANTTTPVSITILSGAKYLSLAII